uniref:Reverse transcriptase domain-containing protein n=1 Tax=Tanacetum cinerariifolium TaxID=118510 RepID=A0A699H5A5_TANCI|nr:reverse transcriptase domain-containing protein [Tanacetum cinerariifolium]
MKGSDLDAPATYPEALSQGVAILSHQGKEVQKDERCSKDWRMVYSTGLETKGRVRLRTQMTQSIDHTTITAETLKAATRVLTQEKRSLFLKNVITKEHPHEGQKRCRRARVAQKGIESQSQSDKGRVLRTTCLNCGYKLECRDVKGASECMKIFGFMHGITNPELIKRLHDKISKSVDGMMKVTTTFLRGEVTPSNRERKKSFPSWKQQDAGQKQNFKKGGFRNQQRPKQKQDIFTLLTKTPKEILALDKGKFKPPPPMTTPVEKRNASKFYEFHREVGHATDDRKYHAKAAKKGEISGKDKSLVILMVQPWQRVAKQKITQTFSPESVISFPPLREEDGTEGPMIIEAEMGGHFVHCMYVDGGSSSEIMYEHCFNRFRPERNNKEAMSKENPGNSVHSPRNAKIPSGRRNGYTTEQQDHSAIMHNGFRTRDAAANNQPICRRKDPVAIHPEYPKKLWQYAPPGCQTTHGEKIRRQLEDVRGFQGLKQSMPQRRLSAAENRLEGTFLGYKVDVDGLRVCPDKIEAVLNLPSPKCLKDVQKLNGKLASLNRFLYKSAKKYLPFFKTLKKCTKKSDFQWTKEAKIAFKQMKKLIFELPILTAPKEKDELIMYLAAAKEAISAVLMMKRDKKQMHIYFVSRALQGPEVNYTQMEKLILALVSASKQLKRYFHAYTIAVITDQPIKHMLSNPEITGRLLKWRFELDEHDIHYRPRMLVKGQILADFIIKRPKDDHLDTLMDDKEEFSDPWILFTDRSSCIDGSRAGLIITNPKGIEFTYALRNSPSNKYPEEKTKKQTQSKMESTSFAHLRKQVLVEELKKKSIDEIEVLTIVEDEGSTWMTPIYEYLTYEIILEKRGRQEPYVARQANYVLREIHEGSCSVHSGPRTMVEKALRSGYYWTTMHTDARNLIRECSSCQVHRPVPRNPQQKLTPITSPWPFYK